MRKYIRWAFIALALSVPLVVIGFFVGMRHAPLTPAQQLALARMSAPTPPVKGADASDAMWTLGYDVPVDRQAEAAEAIRRYELAGGARSKRPDPRAQWPRFPDPPRDVLCAAYEPGCLAKVSENRALVANAVDANRGALEALRAIVEYDGYRRGMPESYDSTFPPVWRGDRVLRSELALRFVSGEQLSAVEATCHDIAGWRRVSGNSDDLTMSMVGVSWIGDDLHLLADMLAKLPRETELPAECTTGLQPSADYEFDLCPSMRSEFRLLRKVRPAYEANGELKGPSWMIDWRHLDAMIAEEYGAYCEPSLPAKLRTDRLARVLFPPSPRCIGWRKRADPIGCEIFESAPQRGWTKYFDRRADQAQMLALMRTVLWLRSEVDSKEAVAAALTHVPTELGLLRTPIYDFEHDLLSISLHDTEFQPRFELAAGAEPRPVSHRRRLCCSRRPSRNLAALDDVHTLGVAP